MIKTRHRDGRLHTVFVCDVCGRQIEDKMGIAIDRDKPTDGEFSDLMHVHKGACDKAATARLGGEAVTGWHEITSHILRLADSIGTPLDDLAGHKERLDEAKAGLSG